jgi:hypothetical protein
MKNVSKLVASLFFIGFVTASAQKNSETDVGIVLDMRPVLQLDMTTDDQISFVFNNKQDFANGITKNSATILKVTSTVKWDLYAVGRSTGKSTNGKLFGIKKKVILLM